MHVGGIPVYISMYHVHWVLTILISIVSFSIKASFILLTFLEGYQNKLCKAKEWLKRKSTVGSYKGPGFSSQPLPDLPPSIPSSPPLSPLSLFKMCISILLACMSVYHLFA